MQNTVERNVSKDLPCRSLSLGVRFVCLPDPSSRYLPPSPSPRYFALVPFEAYIYVMQMRFSWRKGCKSEPWEGSGATPWPFGVENKIHE